MPETHQIVTKVWIAPGCIVCDACENDCPEVFDVTEDTCLIRPPAQSAAFLDPLTPSIIVAMEGCPVEVIKIETKEVAGPAPWANQPAGAPAAGAVVEHKAAKAAAPVALPDPKWQALLSTSKISASLSASLNSSIRKPGKADEVLKSEEFSQAAKIEGIDLRNAAPDQRIAMLAAGGAYVPKASMGDRIRATALTARSTSKLSRRSFNFALILAWGMIGITTATFGAMFQAFFAPKVLKEPKKQWRVGHLDDYSIPGVYENFKRTPAGSAGFWLVNLSPSENKLVALSTICTHLGCIPNWLASDSKFKCPCHGSGYYITGVNFEGPTPRPLERHAIYRDGDGWIVVDQSKIFRSELGEWDNPESYLALT